MKNKWFNSIAGSLLIIALLNSCEKDSNGNGNILASVIHDGKPMPNAVLYLKYNHPASPQNFDKKASTDIYGEVYFNDLAPGSYNLYCNGYDYEGKHYAEGFAHVNIRQRFRQNEVATKIEALKY